MISKKELLELISKPNPTIALSTTEKEYRQSPAINLENYYQEQYTYNYNGKQVPKVIQKPKKQSTFETTKLLTKDLLSINFLLKFNTHLGHKKNKLHPNYTSYIYGLRNNIAIINLEHSLIFLRKVLRFLQESVKKNSKILFVGHSSNEKINQLIEKFALEANQYYINKKWIGGTLTNMNEMTTIMNTHDKNTKNFNKLSQYYSSIGHMNDYPDIIFLIKTSSKEERVNILKEASLLNIPVIGLVDTDENPHDITYPLLTNNDSYKAIWLYTKLISLAIQELINKPKATLNFEKLTTTF